MARPARNVTERFLEKVMVSPSGCHEWTASLHRDGYGKFGLMVDGKLKHLPAHRMAWQLFRGPIPERRWVLHTCDNRRCVNPDHLYIGTPKDNVRDKIERYPGMWGRMKTPFAIVERARALYATGRYSQQRIADELGIDQRQVSRYVRRKQRVSK